MSNPYPLPLVEFQMRVALWAARLPGPPTPETIEAAFDEVPVRFVLWAIRQRSLPSVDATVDRFKISRASAYRLRAHYLRLVGSQPLSEAI